MPSAPGDDQDEHVKTVYAHFGLALYLAQCLEHGLANALLFADLMPARVGKLVPRAQWEQDFDAFMSRQFQQTLGQLVRTLGGVAPLPADLQETLTQALSLRNFLAHHFFRERAEAFMSRDGRDGMITELENAQRVFTTADGTLRTIVDALAKKVGVTAETLEVYEHEYFKTFVSDLE